MPPGRCQRDPSHAGREGRDGYRIGVPRGGGWLELLNSDAEIDGGSNTGNGGSVRTENIGAHWHAASLSLTILPLGMLMSRLVDWERALALAWLVDRQ